MKQLSRTTGDEADIVIDIVDQTTKLPFDGSAHSWGLRVQKLTDYLAEAGNLTFAEISGTYTFSAGVSGYVTFPISSSNSLALLAGEEYVFEVWYVEAGGSPAKPIFVERYQYSMQPGNPSS